ncbi:MAG: hypothetical protein E7588_05750 [Ruminococcaceae bacterium]|nr:hypothetical protein [Oscillospiraceae bacterium]
MSRVKHLVMLVFKLFLVVLCFAAAAVMTALQKLPTSTFEDLNGRMSLENCEIMVMDTDFGETGASLSYEIVDGKIVFDLVQSGENYDDVNVLITYPVFGYDATAMREYLYETLGDKAADEEVYLKAMQEGPWRSKYTYSLTGEENENKIYYTLTDPDSDEYIKEAVGESSSKKAYIKDMYAENGENLTFMLTFGAPGKGALPSGRYVFSADLGVSGLYDEDAPQLTSSAKMKIFTTTCTQAVKDRGLGIFSVDSWVNLYSVVVLIGMFIYIWRDLRSVAKIFCALMESMPEGISVIVKVYVNGVCVDDYSIIEGGPSAIAALFLTLICYVAFVLTYPVRILIHLVRDIVYLFMEDYDIDGYSITGNTLGSVGVYVTLFGIGGLMSARFIIGGICTVVGLAMCIAAYILCKRCEEYA